MSTPDVPALRERLYNATIAGERRHHGTVIVFRVRPDVPVPSARPGQWLELGLGVWEPVMPGSNPGGAARLPADGLIRRSYSLSSPILTRDGSRLIEPGELDGFEFLLSLVIPPQEYARKIPNLTGRLFCLKPGDRLFMSEVPMGSYSLDPVRPEDDVLFLSTGTGEAPHNLMIWDLLRRGHTGRLASVVSVRHRADLAYDDVHRRLTPMFPQYRYAAVATRDPGSDGRHLQELLQDGTLEQMAGFALDPARTQVYLCGNPGMIGPPRMMPGKRVYPTSPGMVELLEQRGFQADHRAEGVNVHYERYW